LIAFVAPGRRPFWYDTGAVKGRSSWNDGGRAGPGLCSHGNAWAASPISRSRRGGWRGADCKSAAARNVINGAGFGPGYATPGLPHRTGHGIGLDLHEWPYLVKGDKTVLKPGMTFSNEPTICIYGEFGARLEDHIVITEAGARWFTEPAYSVDDPFGLER
jgi:hypothetical protein